MNRTKWIDRTFDFDFPEGWLPNILERLHGTEVRMIHMTRSLSEEELSKKAGDKWSIKEHIGHLSDLEDLHISRIREMMEMKPELTAADMKNKKTEEAAHNDQEVIELIGSFSGKRKVFIDLLTSLDDNVQLFKSLHPRLKIYMRPVDVAYFTAEHDDHHLASIREILDGKK